MVAEGRYENNLELGLETEVVELALAVKCAVVAVEQAAAAVLLVNFYPTTKLVLLAVMEFEKGQPGQVQYSE